MGAGAVTLTCSWGGMGESSKLFHFALSCSCTAQTLGNQSKDGIKGPTKIFYLLSELLYSRLELRHLLCSRTFPFRAEITGFFSFFLSLFFPFLSLF